MAKARAIIKRRKAVQNIRKVTRTMQLIATARFQGSVNRATGSKPYTEQLTRLVRQLSRDHGDLVHPLLRANTESKRSRLLVLTSNRGLCGGYNAAVLRSANGRTRAGESAGDTVDLHVYGKKGISYFRFLGREMARTDAQFDHKPEFADLEPIATEMIEAYERREVDSVHVSYMEFVSAGVQRAQTVQLLPIEPLEREDDGLAPPAAFPVPYEFTPAADVLLGELLPETVKIRLFQCFMEAAVSEQAARMVAMKAATDAAGDMISTLTQQYNRARQGQITLDLLDIVTGAEVLV